MAYFNLTVKRNTVCILCLRKRGGACFTINQSPPPHDPHGKRLNRTIYTTFIIYSVAEFLIFITSWLTLIRNELLFRCKIKKRVEYVTIASND